MYLLNKNVTLILVEANETTELDVVWDGSLTVISLTQFELE